MVDFDDAMTSANRCQRTNTEARTALTAADMTSFQRQDWTLFRNLGTLGQKAGVADALDEDCVTCS
jgi:hypothetical protein